MKSAMSKSVFLSPATKGTRDLTEAASPKISLSPIEFSKGLLAKLSVLRAQKPGFFSPEEKPAPVRVYFDTSRVQMASDKSWMFFASY